MYLGMKGLSGLNKFCMYAVRQNCILYQAFKESPTYLCIIEYAYN